LPQVGKIELYEIGSEIEIDGHIAKGGKNLFPDPYFQEVPQRYWQNQWHQNWLEHLPGNIGNTFDPPILVNRDSFKDDLIEYGPFPVK
jgi:hypothetical protein